MPKSTVHPDPDDPLVGRTLRVPDAPTSLVEEALAAVPARLSERPATLEERFLQLATGRLTEEPGR